LIRYTRRRGRRVNSAVQGVTLQRHSSPDDTRSMWRPACPTHSRARGTWRPHTHRRRALAFLTSTRECRTDNEETIRTSHREYRPLRRFIWLRGRGRRITVRAAASGRVWRNAAIGDACPPDSTSAASRLPTSSPSSSVRALVGDHHDSRASLFAVGRNDRRERYGHLAGDRR
jgi:hypothetical protein